MKNATRSWMAVFGLSAGLVNPLGAIAQVADCCGASAPTPTSYVTTSYAVPTTQTTVMRPVIAYEAPVIYESTGYLVERPTRGLFSNLFRPRVRETTYVETSYVPPTYDFVTPTRYTTTYIPTTVTVDLPVVETSITSADPCSTTVPVINGSVYNGNGNGSTAVSETRQQVTAAPQTTVTNPPKSVQSRTAVEPGRSSASPPPSDGASSAGIGGNLNEPAYEFPASPRPEKTGTDSEPSSGGVVAPLDDATSRSSYKPRPTELARQQSSSGLGALRGQVITGADGKAESSIRVVFSDLRNTFKDRERESDASGRFEVMLPNGDWAVNVVEPDGKQTSYGTITVTSGRFFDQQDRPISSIRINH